MGRVSWAAVGVVALGGALGALVRYGLGVAFPHAPGSFPWVTFAINVTGCLFIGALAVVVATQRLLRLLVGTGILGGFTTFSTYVVDVQQLIGAGRAGLAMVYLGGTVVSALAAVWAGDALARRLR